MPLFKDKGSVKGTSPAAQANPTVTVPSAVPVAESPAVVFGKQYNDLPGSKADNTADKVGMYSVL